MVTRSGDSTPDRIEITADDVRRGASAAQRRLGALVHEVGLADLSEVDRTTYWPFPGGEGPVKTADIARALGGEIGYAGMYRQRLIDAGLVVPSRHGYIDFALPYLREYLRDHAAALGMP
ncbi:MAG: hypothetical protein ACOYEV_08465 [Candidatus Nanopelagicales bacterium]